MLNQPPQDRAIKPRELTTRAARPVAVFPPERGSVTRSNVTSKVASELAGALLLKHPTAELHENE